MRSCKLDGKQFHSQDGRFGLTLPNNWEEYDDGEENTFAFFNAKSWTGNFRVTPFYWTQPVDKDHNKAAEFVQEELNDNPGSVRLQIGNYDCAHYKKDIVQDGEELVIYYWAVGQKNNLFMCSFTVDKKQDGAEKNKVELKTVENVIASIKTM